MIIVIWQICEYSDGVLLIIHIMTLETRSKMYIESDLLDRESRCRYCRPRDPQQLATKKSSPVLLKKVPKVANMKAMSFSYAVSAGPAKAGEPDGAPQANGDTEVPGGGGG